MKKKISIVVLFFTLFVVSCPVFAATSSNALGNTGITGQASATYISAGNKCVWSAAGIGTNAAWGNIAPGEIKYYFGTAYGTVKSGNLTINNKTASLTKNYASNKKYAYSQINYNGQVYCYAVSYK